MLNRPTLILNRNWQPVNVACVARALVLVCRGTARVVDPHDYQLYTWEDWTRLVPDRDEPCVRSLRLRIRVPEVVALAHYDRAPAAHVTFSRRNIFKRDHFTCQYCGAQPGTDELTLDHVVPRAQGGHVELGELRAGLRGVQQAQGGPDAGAGEDEAAQAADPADLEAALCGLSGADRELVEVPLRSVLEREAGGLKCRTRSRPAPRVRAGSPTADVARLRKAPVL